MPTDAKTFSALPTLRHVPFEDLGLIEALLPARGLTPHYIDVPKSGIDAARLADAPILVVLGGPVGVYEEAAYPFLKDEIALLEKRLARNLPTLGICLGCQLMARALGARVYPGHSKEIGWSRVSLTEPGRRSALGALGDGATVLHWHGDTFDLPEGARHLARSLLYPNQAFDFGASLALQFHLEATDLGLEAWFVGHALEISSVAGLSVASLRRESAAALENLAFGARGVFETWLDGALAASGVRPATA